jgi:hypothetical protein
MFDHRIVVTVHVVDFELLQAHVVAESLEELFLLPIEHVASLHDQFLHGGVGVRPFEDLGAADADQFGVVADVDDLVVEGAGGVDGVGEADHGEAVLGKADGVHGVADLAHHVVHLLILQVALVYDQRPFQVVLVEGEDVLQVLAQGCDLAFVQFDFEVHEGHFGRDYVGDQVYFTGGDAVEAGLQPPGQRDFS